MKFITLWSLKESVDLNKMAEIIGRRAEYQFPDDMELLGEYWTAKRSPAAVAIFEANNAASLMINSASWIDVFDVDVFPANTWEEGLERLSNHFAG